jgi:hypothetical protein
MSPICWLARELISHCSTNPALCGSPLGYGHLLSDSKAQGTWLSGVGKSLVVLPVGVCSVVASAAEKDSQEIADVTVAADAETELDVGF